MDQGLKTLVDRGFYKACTDWEALNALMEKEKVTFYVGCDPTGPSLHIGHMVPFFAMHHLQNAGHNPIALVGGGTAMIGDPSGKTEMRKMLTREQVIDNSKHIKAQLSTVVDFENGGKDGKGTARMIDNADWLTNLNFIDFMREIGSKFSVNRMLTFESYKQRLERGLSFIEFTYQLLQSYDFLHLYQTTGCRLQCGGDDQWGNIVSGTDLIRRMEGAECYGLTYNLITRADGKKMGKSEKGAIFLDPNLTSPYDFYQYWRNVPDADTIKFMKLFTFMELDEIQEYEQNPNINHAKERLAYEQTKITHGEEEADKMRSAAHAVFSTGGDREGMPTANIPKADFEAGIPVLTLFTRSGLTASNGEARRLVEGGGAFVGETKISDVKALIDSSYLQDGELLLKAGKKRFMRVVAE